VEDPASQEEGHARKKYGEEEHDGRLLVYTNLRKTGKNKFTVDIKLV